VHVLIYNDYESYIYVKLKQLHVGRTAGPVRTDELVTKSYELASLLRSSFYDTYARGARVRRPRNIIISASIQYIY
jgi:hypothetical protein